MENRKEYKFVFNSFELINFYSFLKSREFVLHEDRKISSVYFDTFDFDLYKNSKTVDTEKLKIRLRQYNNQGNIYLEKKFNNSNGKYKEAKITNYKHLSKVSCLEENGYYLKPSLKINYHRSYLKLENIRITIDINIQYNSVSSRTLSNITYNPNFKVVEYKLLNNDPDIEKYFYKNPVSFSKYNFGVEKIYTI